MSREHRLELADVFRTYGEQYLERYRDTVSFEHVKVLRDIVECRTAARGGHLYQCTECGTEDQSYNSCRNRHCPKCQGAEAAKWVDARAADLLPVQYFHTVFTLPSHFNELVLHNRAVLYRYFFEAVKSTLTTIGKNNLKCQIGFFAILHTWGQTLQLHPHIHCVIPGCGLSLDGSNVVWFKDRYFVADRILSKVFRGKFIHLLKRAYRKGKLKLTGKLTGLSTVENFTRYLDASVQHDWVVRSKPPFANPEFVVKYLARYTHRVAISNSRLVAIEDNRVCFQFRDYRDEGKVKLTSLDAVHFIERFFLHLVPKGFVRVRHCGFLANSQRKKCLTKLRALILCGTAFPPTSPTETALNSHSTPCCPACGAQAMVCIAELSRTINHLPPGASCQCGATRATVS